MVCKLLSHGGEILIPDRLLVGSSTPNQRKAYWPVEADYRQATRSLSGIGSLEARINNLRAIPGL